MHVHSPEPPQLKNLILSDLVMMQITALFSECQRNLPLLWVNNKDVGTITIYCGYDRHNLLENQYGYEWRVFTSVDVYTTIVTADGEMGSMIASDFSDYQIAGGL